MEEVARFALDLCRSADYAEVRVQDFSSTGFVLRNGVPEASGFDQTKGVAVRVLIKGALGFVCTNNLDKTNIKNVVSQALKIANYSSKFMTKKVEFSDEKSVKGKEIIKPQKDPEDFSSDDKLKLLKELDKELLAEKIKFNSREFSLGHSIKKELFMNSHGTLITKSIPRTNFFWFVTVDEKGKTKQRYMQHDAVKGMEAIKEWNLHEEVIDNARALQKNLKFGKKVVEGVYDVICGPEVVGIAVHESAGHPYEADRIFGRESAQAGESFVTKQMVNTKIGSSLVNVSDDPSIEGTSGYYMYDDDGVKSRKKIILKNGMITEFLHNRESAKEMGVKSNGCARASAYDREPIVRMANTYMEAGKSKKEDIISSVKKGIYLKNFMEWNIDDKRYNQKYVGAEAYYVENGEIKHPLINPALEITTPLFWSSVNMVGKDVERFSGSCGKGEPMQGIPVTMGGPTIKLSNIRIK